MKHTSMKGVMIHANDPGQHTVCWSELGQRWIVENPEKGLLQSCHQLCEALGNLHWRADRAYAEQDTPVYLTRNESIDKVPNTWTMTENPYA